MGYALDPELPNTILNAATATGAGSAYANAVRRIGGKFANYTWQTVLTGAPTGVSITLQGSDDGANWTTIDTSTLATGETRYVANTPVTFLRANVGTLTGGTAPTVTVNLQCGG